MRLTATRCWIEYKEVVIHVLIDLHYTGFISASVAIVRCREDSHNIFLMAPVETLKL